MLNKLLNRQDWQEIMNELKLGEIIEFTKNYAPEGTRGLSKNSTEITCQNTQGKSKYLFNIYGLANFSETGENQDYELKNPNPVLMYYIIEDANEINRAYYKKMLEKDKNNKQIAEPSFRFASSLFFKGSIRTNEIEIEKTKRKLASPTCSNKQREDLEYKLEVCTICKNGLEESLRFIETKQLPENEDNGESGL